MERWTLVGRKKNVAGRRELVEIGLLPLGEGVDYSFLFKFIFYNDMSYIKEKTK